MDREITSSAGNDQMLLMEITQVIKMLRFEPQMAANCVKWPE